jgi:hypothetical protein
MGKRWKISKSPFSTLFKKVGPRRGVRLQFSTGDRKDPSFLIF